MRIPETTYRLQMHKGFGFRRAAAAVPYLAELGVSHIYLSPVFAARKGSAHGYDVVDPRQLNPELGSQRECDLLARTAKRNGLGWLQDIVPNHMAFDSQNAMLMDVLERGKGSPFAAFFDIDWNHLYEGLRGRVLAPFLGTFYADALESGEIQLRYGEDGFAIAYYGFVFPVRIDSYPQILEHGLASLERKLGKEDPDLMKLAGTLHLLQSLVASKDKAPSREQIAHVKRMLWSLYRANGKIHDYIAATVKYCNGRKGDPRSFDALDRLIGGQLFRLSFWKVAAEEINYRRFFTINELISLRVEDDAVFDSVHELILKLTRSGIFAGLRIDHVDGLYDPTRYLKRLRRKAGDTYIVVEKILARQERLRQEWPVQGTTGYDFLNVVNAVLCKKENERVFTRLYDRFTGQSFSFEELVRGKKRLIIGKHLAGAIDNLAHLMKKVSASDRYGRDFTLYGLRRALVEVMANFPVYRTYIDSDHIGTADRRYIGQAIEKARRVIPDFRYEIDFIEQFLLLGRHRSFGDEDRRDLVRFVMQFQQYTAPLMAKGFEDTICYIYNRLISLNEVGGDPSRFGMSAGEFHAYVAARAQNWPHTMNATATHDTKRGEDTRARITVLSELPREWEAHLRQWSAANVRHKMRTRRKVMPDRNDEYFIYQTLVGAYPFSEARRAAFIERMKEYVIKAVREAKIHTAWIEPDHAYEAACIAFIEKVLTPSKENRFLGSFQAFQKRVAQCGVYNSLSQTLLKLTAPGVPDIYQGTELWDLSLVDPDNRRPVDYGCREALLRTMRRRYARAAPELMRELLTRPADGRVKLFLVWRLLQARAERAKLFAGGSYVPLDVQGSRSEHVIAFLRRQGTMRAVSIAPRFYAGLAKEGVLPLGRDVWGDTTLVLPKDTPVLWRDAVTGERVKAAGGILRLADVLRSFPVSLLVNVTPN